MKCEKCGHLVNVLDEVCGGCGSSLSLLGDEPQVSMARSPLDSFSSLLEVELKEMQDELFTPQSLGRPSRNNTEEDGVVFADLAGANKRYFLDLMEVKLTTPKEEVYQIASFVFTSSHVQTNLLYRERAAKTSLVFQEDEDLVNAFATDGKLPGVNVSPPIIVLFGGMTNATRLASLALAYNSVMDSVESHQLLVNVIGALGRRVVESRGCFTEKDAIAIDEQFEIAAKLLDGEVKRRAISYGAAMNMSVIAHELGHIALGHTLSEQRSSLEISRNQEREADSFSASVASTSPFSDYMIAGGIFWWIILTWVEASAGGGRENTHPHSRDRLMDYIRANRDQAKALGMDEVSIIDFLP